MLEQVARKLLLTAGYRPRVVLSEAQVAAELEASHQYGFVREDKRIAVELQWGVTRRFLSSPLDMESLWERLQPVSLAEKTVLNLAPEDLLLLLCVHGTKHCWSRLAWICDVAELVRAYPELGYSLRLAGVEADACWRWDCASQRSYARHRCPRQSPRGYGTSAR